jgi:two-component system chemotaxis response regulator CheB
MAISVLIVDDSVFMRTIIRDMLSKDPEIEVVGVANDGEDALEKIRDLSPDVMTLDIEMPRLDGIGVLERKRTVGRFPKTLMLSALTAEGADMTRRAMLLGADDFMLKPRGITTVRDIEKELLEKIKNLVRIKTVQKKARPAHEDASGNLVLIGSSAGGPPMLDAILSALPENLNASVLITQHMPEGGFTAALASRLDRITPISMKETETGDILMSGHGLVSKAGYHTIISGFIADGGIKRGKVTLSQAPPLHNVRPAVDKTFVSASHVFGPRVVSVILSGMGNDGGAGTAAVKAAGGTTMVCREQDCLVYGMARSALSTGSVDMVLPLKDIAGQLVAAVNRMGGS